MKAYILRADHLYSTMTLVESGVSTTLEYEEKDNKGIFIGVEPGDMVMGYVAAPISMVKSVFKVTEVVSKSKIVFEKVIEANVGPALPEALEQRIQMKDFVDISTTQFEDLFNKLIVMLKPEHVAEETDVFSGFSSWLTTYNNPDYTGKEKYASYPSSLKKLVNYMFEKTLIDDPNLNDLNVDKYQHILDAYYSSEEAQQYDKDHCSSNAGRAALTKYISYIRYLLNPTYDYKLVDGKGENLVIYGTPGCGKSYYVMHHLLMEDQQDKAGAFKKDHIFRTTFYQDYTNTDFVGQVMPVVQYQKDESGAEESIVTYKFVPGPFTLALECAIANPTEKVALVIEELNRGNAASIFGDLFQLLDRVDEVEKSDFPLCTSEYGILNVNIVAYLKDREHYDKKYKYSFDLDEIRIPANLYIYATMNTSDQNVYTLDTAFKRRWGFEKLKNIFKDNHDYADYLVPGMPGITWKQLATDINMFIVSDSNMLASEDKQIGVYFIGKNLLLAPDVEPSAEEVKRKQEKFAYKLFEYLWDDVAKFSHDRWFGKIKTLDELIEKFMNGEKVFVDGIVNQKDQ